MKLSPINNFLVKIKEDCPEMNLSSVLWYVSQYSIIAVYTFVCYFEFWVANIYSLVTSSTKFNYRACTHSSVKEMTVHLEFESVKLSPLPGTKHNQRKLEILFNWHFFKGTNNIQPSFWVIYSVTYWDTDKFPLILITLLLVLIFIN